MKQIIASFLILGALHVQAQDIDRTKAPKPLAAPVINIPDAANFTLPNGLKVFVVRNTKLPKVTASLTFDVEAIKEGDKAGLQEMAGQLIRYGTTTKNKVQLDEAIDFLGGTISTSGLSISGSSLSNNFPTLFGLMADITLRPAFNAKELEKIRTQSLSGLESNKDDAKAISSNITSVLLYGKNHPYGEIETEASIKKITIADVKKFYNTYWKPNIAYLVLVGDITVDQAKVLATKNFGTWAKGIIPKQTFPTVASPAKTYIAIVDKPSAVQSVISIVTPVQLQPGTPDAIPTSVLNTILGGSGLSSRLNQNLRELHAYTYGAGSSITPDRLVGRFAAGASVRNEKTDSAVGEFINEINRIKADKVGDEELSGLKNYMSGGFARSLEQPATIARFALNIARYNLPKDYYRNYLTTLAAVNSDKVQEEAKKYLGNGMVITVVGNAKEIAPGLEKYGEIKYFDIYGNQIAAPVTKEVAAGVTGEDILKKAIAAYGGDAAIAAVKDIEMTGTMAVMGQEAEFVQKNIIPNGYLFQVKMQGMTAMEQKKKGNVYSQSQMGQEAPLDDEDKADLDAKAVFFEEKQVLATAGNVYTVKGIEQVDGKDAYVLVTKNAAGKETTNLYDVESGFKVQDRKEADAGPMGKMTIKVTYSDYKPYGGVQIPTKLSIDQGQMKPVVTITSVKVNQGLKESDL